MGNRSNVFIQQNRHENGEWSGIGIYSHWRGQEMLDLAETVAANDIAQGRVGDPSYFARIVVQNVLNAIAKADEPTGAGLWTDGPDDNDGYPVLVINAMTGKIWHVTADGAWRKDQGCPTTS